MHCEHIDVAGVMHLSRVYYAVVGGPQIIPNKNEVGEENEAKPAHSTVGADEDG